MWYCEEKDEVQKEEVELAKVSAFFRNLRCKTYPFIIGNTLLIANALEHVLDSRHHALEAAKVDVGTVVKLGEYLISVFLNLVLDVHLASLLVLLLTGKSIVQTEVVRELLLGGLPLVIIKESIAVSDTKEEPGLTLVGIAGGRILDKKAADETAVRGNTGTSSNHDVVGRRILLREEHNLAGGASHHDLSTGLSVAKEVGADTLLGRIVGLELRAPVGGTTHTERTSLSRHVITITGGGDRVQTDGVGLTVLLTDTRGHDSPGLSFPVREVALVINDDVACFPCSLGPNDTLGGHNLACEGGLVLVNIYRNGGLIVVGLSLEEVLLSS